jgi:hypothetical protein
VQARHDVLLSPTLAKPPIPIHSKVAGALLHV